MLPLMAATVGSVYVSPPHVTVQRVYPQAAATEGSSFQGLTQVSSPRRTRRGRSHPPSRLAPDRLLFRRDDDRVEDGFVGR